MASHDEHRRGERLSRPCGEKTWPALLGWACVRFDEEKCLRKSEIACGAKVMRLDRRETRPTTVRRLNRFISYWQELSHVDLTSHREQLLLLPRL